MKKCLFLILILSLSLSSCKKADNPDHSLTPEEYREFGLPDHSRIWSMEDYSTAFFVLNTLKYENPKALPARESEKSGEVFERMISLDNLAFLQDETLPLWARADRIKWFVNTLMELKVTYTLVGMERQYYARELMDIDIFRVSVAHKMLDLGLKINDSDDPSDMAMKGDYPHIRKMYVDIVSELLEEQQQTGQYPKETLVLLGDSLSASVKMNMHWFDANATNMIKQGMGDVIKSTSSRKIKSEYRELTKVL